MAKKIAIDWDENELRLVAAQCSGASVKVTDAAVIPIGEAGIEDTLRQAISQRGLGSTDTLVAIGRGKAELRELQLPPVPDDELPDMVRFQAIRSFASSGDRATVDYLVTKRDDIGVEMIAAAVAPESLSEISTTCGGADLQVKRIGLRPLAAAALYLTRRGDGEKGDTVLIDLLSDDAEIVVARDGHVVFVRTVRMPSGAAARPKALASELRRSLVACGSSGSALNRVVLWGLKAVHQEDVDVLAEASGVDVDVLDPFEIVEVEKKLRGELPDHVGRLAPLVGLIASDEGHADRLIDFLNPRERVEETPNQFKRAAIIGVPVALVVIVAFMAWQHLQTLDAKIALLKTTNAKMQPKVDDAIDKIDKTEKVDQFLDVNVNWLSEMRRLAQAMPESDKMIVRSISASGDIRNGGGTLQVSGGVIDPPVLESFEAALRDDSHRVEGDGSSRQDSGDSYRWTARESIMISPGSIRAQRYTGLAPKDESDDAESMVEDAGDETDEEVADKSDEADEVTETQSVDEDETAEANTEADEQTGETTGDEETAQSESPAVGESSSDDIVTAPASDGDKPPPDPDAEPEGEAPENKESTEPETKPETKPEAETSEPTETSSEVKS